MRTLLVLLTSSLLMAAAAAPVSLVQNEYNFAAAVADKGTRDGFLMYLDKQAIGFDPTPKNAYDSYTQSKPNSTKLLWYPTFALLASSGDFGVDSGPWVARWTKDGKQNQAYGEWLTVWTRNKDGQWKALFDGGTDLNAEDKTKALAPDATVPRLPVVNGPALAADDVHDQLVRAETLFSNEASDESLRSAYSNSGAADLRLMLENTLPILGRNLATQVAPAVPAGLVWLPSGGSVAKSNDLGYVYGMTYKMDDSKHTKPQGVYMHVWRKDPDGWKLIIAEDTPL